MDAHLATMEPYHYGYQHTEHQAAEKFLVSLVPCVQGTHYNYACE